MKRKTKIVLISLILVMTFGSFMFYQTFYAPHRDITSEKATLTITATTLQHAFAENDAKANKDYADKVIAVNGVITTIEQNTIMLDQVVQVDFLNEIATKLILGDALSLKGRCVGYDDLLEVVKIDQATLITKN